MTDEKNQDQTGNVIGTEVITVREPPKLPEKWEYEQSVIGTKKALTRWRTLTGAVAEELYIAREKLSAQGKRTDLGSNEPKLPTWEQYCEAINIPKSTANRWLAAVYGEKQLAPGGETEYKETVSTVIVKCTECKTKFHLIHVENADDPEKIRHRIEPVEQ